MKNSMKALFAISLLSISSLSVAKAIKGTNYQSPSCGCCTEWVDHMEENGFDLDIVYKQDIIPVKVDLGIQPQYASCHTAEIGGYTFEGHVPAEEILRFIESKPERMIGLAVPGMPMGSPGMEYNNQKDPYEVLAFDEDGKTMVWSRHNQS
ncbi:copper amine oxidase [Photobacterium sanctipauli]|uniref:Copper amine oxidase n=1 Tax=Photobacterium sanctipauli TaxID=1342794 RepID=A0A2T3NAI3_9GAMM|nr:DUF411 domain-containing protein [Photobacterium sanctipauli]PSW10750.1 copper amine oxidase [Photobacterium sanctipauli]